MENDLKNALKNQDLSKLLNEVLDKLDKQNKRKNLISFLISPKKLPSLYTNKSFETKYDLEVLLVEKIFELSNNKKDEFVPLEEKQNTKLIFNFSKENFLRKVYNREKILSQKEEWNILLENYFEKNSELYKILEKSPFFIPFKTNTEVLEKLKLWCKNPNKTKLRRHESAKCFWAMSKVFDNKEEFCFYFNLQERPILLQAHGKSSRANKILFIENLETFISCIESSNPIFDDFILINSYGYKTSSTKVRQEYSSKLFFNSSCNLTNNSKNEFLSWFYSKDNTKEVFFWGDLDFEGVSILAVHQKSFTSLKAWKCAYELMIKELLNNNGHSLESTNKTNQKLPEKTLCLYTNKVLIPLIKEKKLFIDQELIKLEDLK